MEALQQAAAATAPTQTGIDMDNADIKKMGAKKLTQEVVTHTSDPSYYAGLGMMPNPDTVLRKLNRSEEVFDALMGDAHVLGELRSVRSGLLGYEHRVQAGGESAADIRAHELCENYLKTHRPAPGLRWADVFWNMGLAVFYGRRHHEVVWNKQLIDGYRLPFKIIDRPNRRFTFTTDNELRLITKATPVMGEEIDDKRILMTRHMPSSTNPYGVAVFSACFWPYVFKHAGFKFYSKFVEKYGMPWVSIEMPAGSTDDQRNEAVELASKMVEDAIIAFQQGGSASLIETKHSGKPVQEPFINLCNREISKAMTSQTQATENQGVGSNAASQSAMEREQNVHGSGREIICSTMDELFAWITEVNVAGAVPPKFQFYQEEEVQKERIDFIKTATEIFDVPKKWAYDALQVPVPQDGEEVLQRSVAPTLPTDRPSEFSAHSCPRCSTDFTGNENSEETNATNMAADEADVELEKIIEQAGQMLAQFEADGKSLAEYKQALNVLLNDQPKALADKAGNALMASMLQGMEGAG